MEALIATLTLAEYLRADTDLEEDQLEQFILEASAIVMNYLKIDVPVEWLTTASDSPTGTGVPYDVQAAVKAVAAELYKNREATSNPLSENVRRLLHRRRDPALA